VAAPRPGKRLTHLPIKQVVITFNSTFRPIGLFCLGNSNDRSPYRKPRPIPRTNRVPRRPIDFHNFLMDTAVARRSPARTQALGVVANLPVFVITQSRVLIAQLIADQFGQRNYSEIKAMPDSKGALWTKLGLRLSERLSRGACNVGPGDRITERSRKFCSSRIFPGQS
jgi:hypothetical protein